MERVGALAAKEFQVGPSSRSYGLCSLSRLGAAQEKSQMLSAVASLPLVARSAGFRVQLTNHATQTVWKDE